MEESEEGNQRKETGGGRPKAIHTVALVGVRTWSSYKWDGAILDIDSSSHVILIAKRWRIRQKFVTVQERQALTWK